MVGDRLKAAGDRYVAYDAIVEELLCFGWVDSLPRALDDLRTVVFIAPRKSGSGWSAANKARVERLTAEGFIAPAGAAVIAAARADGSWDRSHASDSGEAPDDLAAALRAAGPLANWQGFTLSTRKRGLEFLLAAETRARRVATITEATVAGQGPTRWSPQRG
jgi:uncharacterized protein YdeI (YjbR/CyaY-like superfamily)